MILATSLVAALAVGCGSGGGETSSSQTQGPLTKAAFVKKANALCEAANDRRTALIEEAAKEFPAGQKVTAKEREELVPRFLPPVERLSEELAQLEAPAGEEAKVEKIVLALKRAVARSQAEPQSAVTGAAFSEWDKAVAGYGLGACRI